MSPQAIRDVIALLGVEDGLLMLNLLAAPEEWYIDARFIRQRVDVPIKNTRYSSGESNEAGG